MKNYDYGAINPGYYHESLIHGKNVQRFWHKEKFDIVIRKIPNKKVKILDIGCASGSFFHFLKKQNKKADLYGTDLAKEQLDYAKKLVPNAKFFQADAAKIKSKKTYDFITMLEFIEHVPIKNEVLILKNVRKMLKKDGTLIITTPNYSSHWPIVEIFWNKWSPIDYTHQHINKKTFFNIKKSIEESGLEIKSVRTIFCLSPFISIFSIKLAQKVFEIERKVMPYFGMTLVVEAKVKN